MEDAQTQPEEPTEELRLFPLNVVLFPGMTMPLRIFEERYKLMIGECLDAKEPFGVTLIQAGPEVGGAATPHRTGTTARITNVERLNDGRMNLATLGERRFRIVDTVHQVPYLKARVHYLPEELGEVDQEELARLRGLFKEYLRGLASLQGGWVRQAHGPADPGALSHTVAHYMELPAMAKQRLLEIAFIGERIHYEVPLLEGANLRLQEQVVGRSPFKGPRLN